MGDPIVYIGDDFTGASDSLSTYARAGRRTRLLIDPWDQIDDEVIEVHGFATDLRSLGPDSADRQIARLWPRVAALDPRILHYKVCSTFDSGPQTGSIGAAIGTLSNLFRPHAVAVVGGQPGLGRWCLFGNLFARGPGGEVYRIDRHPVMARHPVTPMHEADLRRHLGAQGMPELSSASLVDLADPDMLADRLSSGPLLFDVASYGDQDRIAAVLARMRGRLLIVGASSVAEILSSAARTHGGRRPLPSPPSSQVVIFAGSRSSVTAEQVQRTTSMLKVPVDPETISKGYPPLAATEAVGSGKPVLLHLVPDADYALSPSDLADRAAELLRRLLTNTPAGWLGLAGGDTSSRICTALGFGAIEFDRPFDPTIALCVGRHTERSRDGVRIFLKGGQLGAPDLFDRFLEASRSMAQ